MMHFHPVPRAIDDEVGLRNVIRGKGSSDGCRTDDCAVDTSARNHWPKASEECGRTVRECSRLHRVGGTEDNNKQAPSASSFLTLTLCIYQHGNA